MSLSIAPLPGIGPWPLASTPGPAASLKAGANATRPHAVIVIDLVQILGPLLKMRDSRSICRNIAA